MGENIRKTEICNNCTPLIIGKTIPFCIIQLIINECFLISSD